MEARATALFDEAIDILARLVEDGGQDAEVIATRLRTSVLPTIEIGEDLDLAETLLDEVVGDIFIMGNKREGRG